MGFNPVRFVESVTSQFRRYQLTAFPIANRRLAAQARALLGDDLVGSSPLVRGPYVSLARQFEDGPSLAELVAQHRIHPVVANVAEHPRLFAHQSDVLDAVGRGKNVIVSTGTGSGKTESF